ncbi:hypothetical protein [Haladaptatus litoreus]|uniref:hypothetical protein n=1 Tax=Haladaptatus litoreus TaxID=553468 RepID=UPI000970B0C7|nr:hypothetical protein [Haladaptatus litoreus]
MKQFTLSWNVDADAGTDVFGRISIATAKVGLHTLKSSMDVVSKSRLQSNRNRPALAAPPLEIEVTV